MDKAVHPFDWEDIEFVASLDIFSSWVIQFFWIKGNKSLVTPPVSGVGKNGTEFLQARSYQVPMSWLKSLSFNRVLCKITYDEVVQWSPKFEWARSSIQPLFHQSSKAFAR